MSRLLAVMLCTVCVVCQVHFSNAAPPVCTVQFFDWYEVTPKSPLEQQQQRWTYQIRWQDLGIEPEEIGHSEHYYRVQFEKIRDAGYDGIHYEWHGKNPKPQFLAAARQVGIPLAMFYDMEIRFHRRGVYLTPTEEFAQEVIGDVLSFYRAVPKSLWLRDRNGRLPIIVYGYAFDRGVTDPARWDKFYRRILSGIQQGLGEKIVFHWTDAAAPQQVYGYQHFPEIQSFSFNEAVRQTQINAHSVTFVVHYDDLGVSFARGGRRPQRWIRNDVRYLQEALWLALHTNPDLVFNYGWNELYEGEQLLPDASWGSWRYELASAMVRHIKQHARADLPRVLVIADDLLPAMHEASPTTRAMLHQELRLLERLRTIVPQADVVLPDSPVDLDEYEVIFSLNSIRTPEEDAALAECGRKVVFVSADAKATTALTRLFTDKARQRVAQPANEFVVARREVDIDLTKYPILQFRCRNTPGAVFHIRYTGEDAEGKSVRAWDETSPTDDRHTDGRWEEAEADVAAIARRAAGKPVARLKRIELILDDLERNGEFALDVDYLRMVDRAGRVGWEDTMDSLDAWEVGASFEKAPEGKGRFGLQVSPETEGVARLWMKAVFASEPFGAVDHLTRRIEPLPEVRVVEELKQSDLSVPLLLARDRFYWLNTYSPTDKCWEKLIPDLLGLPVQRGVMFCSYSHTLTPAGLTSRREQAAMVVQECELPIDRVRLVAPPELPQPLPHTLPASSRPLSLRIISSERQQIPFPDPGSNPPSITLRPGEIVELLRGEQSNPAH